MGGDPCGIVLLSGGSPFGPVRHMRETSAWLPPQASAANTPEVTQLPPLMKLFAALATLALVAAPVQAQSYPTWADAISDSVCTYVSIGIAPSTAMVQAVHDNSHWADEAGAAEARGVFMTIVGSAVTDKCGNAVVSAAEKN